MDKQTKNLDSNRWTFLPPAGPEGVELNSDAEAELLKQGALLGSYGASDADMAESLAESMKHLNLSPDKATGMLFRTLVRLGAYRNALDRCIASVPPAEEMFRIYLRCLFHCGEPRRVLEEIGIRKEQMSDRAESEAFWAELERLELLARLTLDEKGEEISAEPRSLQETIAVIRLAVEYGQIAVATKLTAAGTAHAKPPQTSDPHLACALIRALYAEGYLDLAKEQLARLGHGFLRDNRSPFRETAYIYGEMLHDDGLYDEAAAIFESLAATCPDMAEARFAAGSCYLQAALSRLTGRISLYRPDETERAKINKHLNELNQALEIISTVPWHTEWTYAQRRNFPRKDDDHRPH